MRRLVSVALAGVAFAALCSPQAALAQSSDSAPPAPSSDAAKPVPAKPKPAAPKPAAAKPAPKAQEASGGEVVVTGKAAMSISIDRRSYSVAGDLHAAAGSIADALRNVPSVEVDVQGNVSIRGDSSVTILVDGRPAPQFDPSTRADALQALPADRIDRIEVMTNPSAEFSSQGTGGVINIVTKAGGGTGPSTTVRGAVGTGGRFQASGTTAVSLGKVQVTADGSFRRDPRTLFHEDYTVTPGATGLTSDAQTSSTGRSDIANLGAKFDYALDDKTHLTAGVRALSQYYLSDGVIEDWLGPSASALTPQYIRDNDRTYQRDLYTLSAGFKHSFSGDQHELSIDWQHLYFPRHDVQSNLDAYRLSATTPVYENVVTDWPLNDDTFTVVYRRPMPASGRLVVGVDGDIRYLPSDTVGVDGPSAQAAVADPTLADHFRANYAHMSYYGTYQQPLGKLTVLAGLRIETVGATIKSDGVTEPHIGFFNVDPTLNMSYALDPQTKLSLAYSRRIDQPQPISLDPGLVYLDPVTFREGNLNLKPAITDSFEAGYERRQNGTTLLATFYYRHNTDLLTAIDIPLGAGILAVQPANAASGQNGGLELVADGPLFGKLHYNVSGNFYYSELQDPGVRLSGLVVNGRANLNWTPEEADLFQMNVIAVGRGIYPQGYTDPRFALNFGYRRHVSGDLYLTVTADDVTGGFSKYRGVFASSPNVTGWNFTRFNGPALTVGFSYAFGGPANRTKPPPGLDYGGGSAAAP